MGFASTAAELWRRWDKLQHHGAWLLDLDGTLYHALPLRSFMLAELATAGPRSLAVLRRFRKEHEWLREHQAAPLTNPFQTQLERTAEALGLPLEQVSGEVERWMFERPQRWLPLCRRTRLLQAAARFKAAGGKLAVVSDYPARRKLAALGWGALPDCVVAVGEPGGPRWLKPHPEGYRNAAERLGVPPSHCVVIGDRDDADGAAARAGGMLFELSGP
jgi:FMN phosphatase YigB (HAD superfamily)